MFKKNSLSVQIRDENYKISIFFNNTIRMHIKEQAQTRSYYEEKVTEKHRNQTAFKDSICDKLILKVLSTTQSSYRYLLCHVYISHKMTLENYLI